MLRMIVWGTPIPQGSKTIRVLPSGKTVIREANNKTKPWRKEIAKACEGRVPEPIDGPVIVRLFFVFDALASAPKRRRIFPSTKSSGDVDKLCRAVLDGLVEGKVLADDSRVCGLIAAKDYAPDGERPRVQIEVQPFDAGDEAGTWCWPEGWADRTTT